MTPPFAAIALLSAAALAYQVLLLRLFAIVQWHHFAYLIISLALLGYGASGTFLALVRARTQRHFGALFAANAALFGVSALACFALVQRLPFNPPELFWDARQIGYLALMYGLLSLPFFFVANAIGLSFQRFRKLTGHIYSADLLGAGSGALGIVLALFVLPPDAALRALAGLGWLAAALALGHYGQRRAALLALLGALLPWWLPPAWIALQPSPYKALSQTLQAGGARLAQQRSSPLGVVSVVENRAIPFRYAPGLSLNSLGPPPEQVGVFVDGDGPTVIDRFGGRLNELVYLNYLTSALPYHLLAQPDVLVLGAGGGSEVLQAVFHRARHVEAVELNPDLVRLVARDYADFAGGLYQRPDVTVHIGEARGFVAATPQRYDLIQMALTDAFGASSAGLYALSENYLYTVEALRLMLDRLKPGGMLAFTRWIKLPPRDSLKLFATALAALEQAGVAEPGRHLALIRSWKTSTLLVKNTPFSPDDIAAVRAFCAARAFDTAYYPGLPAAQANRYNLLDEDYFYQGAQALLGAARDDFLARYKYDLTPARDDRPYFFNFFKWRALDELFAQRGQGGLGLVEWGYPVLLATLAQAALFSLLWIVLPLWLGARPAGQARKLPVFGYFLALGLAFLFLEIAFIQKFILFLSHPLYAAAGVLCAFLIFAGLGSRYAAPLHAALVRRGAGKPLAYVAGAIALCALFYVHALPPLFALLAGLPDPVKLVVAVLLLAPLAFCMGMPFPLGLSRLTAAAPEWLAWAWAINGCASVLGAVLATLLAVHLGFTWVVGLAAGLYGLAAWAYSRF